MSPAIAKPDEDLIRALEMGADDFLHKPLHPRILGLRIRAILRRAQKGERLPGYSKYIDPYLAVDIEREEVQMQGRRIKLTFLERRLLDILIRNIETTVT